MTPYLPARGRVTALPSKSLSRGGGPTGAPLPEAYSLTFHSPLGPEGRDLGRDHVKEVCRLLVGDGRGRGRGRGGGRGDHVKYVCVFYSSMM